MIEFLFNILIIMSISVVAEINYHKYLSDYGVRILAEECTHCHTILIVDTKNNSALQLFAETVIDSRNPSFNHLDFFTIVLENYTFIEHGKYMMGYHPDMTFIFLNQHNYLEIENVIYGLEETTLWNIRGKFVVILADAVDTHDVQFTWIPSFFDAFRYRQAPYALLCFWNNELNVYSYNPFLNDFAINITNNSMMVSTLFSKITNLYGTPFKLYAFDYVVKDRAEWMNHDDGTGSWVGPDGLFFETVAQIMNGSIEVHRLSDDLSYETVSGADLNLPITHFINILMDLYNFDALLTANRLYSDNQFDIINLYERNDLYILVPTSPLIPKYLYVFLIVSKIVWLATLSFWVLVSVAMFIFQKVQLNIKVDIVSLFLENFRLLLNESIPGRYRSHRDRLVFVLWIYFCLIFSSLFQSSLMAVLVNPKYYTEIDTLQDLYQTDTKVFVAELIKIHLVAELSDENQPLLHHLLTLPREITPFGDTMDWVFNFSFRNNCGIIISQEQIYYLELQSKKSIRFPFHVMKESVMPNPMVYSIRRDKFFFNEIMEIYGRIQAAGINKYWRRHNYGLQRSNTTNSDAIDNNDDLILAMDNLQSAFLLLVFGYLVSCIVLIFELLIHYCQRIRK